MKRANFRDFVERNRYAFPKYEQSEDFEDSIYEMEDHIDAVRDFLRYMEKEAQSTPNASLGYLNRLSRAIDFMQTAKCECYEMYSEEEA